MRRLIAIAAVGRNGEIGKNGDMPWKRGLKKDLRFFKQQTLHHPVLMGKKTWLSLPHALPERLNVVVTSKSFDVPDQQAVHASSLEEAFSILEPIDDDVYLIGGSSLYQQLIEQCDALVLTEIDADFDADTYFPAFERSRYQATVLDSYEDGGYVCRHVLYEKKPV